MTRGSLFSSNNSISHATDALPGPFPNSGNVSPVSPSTPAANLMLPPAPAPSMHARASATGLAAAPDAPATKQPAQLQEETQRME